MTAPIPVLCKHTKGKPPIHTGYALPPGSSICTPDFKCPDGRVRTHHT